MTVKLVIGTQWGDEGKGKVVDYLSKDAKYVVRFQGGNNAGHTIKVGKETYKLHVIPSGTIQGKIGVIGNGVVIDPKVLLNELESLNKRDIKPKLLISSRANIIMPYHKIIDGAKETYLKNKKIGTTKRGIGPCYSDKIARNGVRAIDLTNKKYLREIIEDFIKISQNIIDIYGIKEKLNCDKIVEEYFEYGKKLKKYMCETQIELNNAIDSKENILLEGAQGTMLDVDFGTYPFTTSSHVIAGGASIGAGISPRKIDDIIGIVKAYTTRVGEGPLPTELFDNMGKHLQKNGHEFGTTTSRPRRCGWLDLVVVKHSCLISGITKIAITKLDVLNGIKNLKICTNYNLDGKIIDYFPANINDVENCKPIYKELDGWGKVNPDIKSYEDLPENAKKYLSFIEKKLGIKIYLISIGPGRNETIEIR